jgi:PTH1 family peptidyl-tRNA hydrolase
VLVVGIGNPGAEYAHTRHNVGFDVLDLLAARRRASFTDAWAGGERHSHVAETRYARRALWLAKPQTYVNCSGPAVQALLGLHGLAPDQCLVVLDDVQLPLGRLRLRAAGSDGGHNGLRSILATLATDRVPRLRVGVGAPARAGGLVRHVLGPFGPDERPVIDAAIARAADCAETWVRAGLAAAMNEFNTSADADDATPPRPAEGRGDGTSPAMGGDQKGA